jgi:hypothetical protein
LVLKNFRTLTATQTYSGLATTITTDLPRDFLIQRILLDFNGTTTIGGGVSVLVVDALLKCVSSVKVKAVGEGSSRTIFDVAGNDLYYMNLFDYGFGTALQNSDTAIGAHTQSTGWTIDFRVNKSDPDDYSVSIPSYLLSTLQLEITYDTSANGYGTNVTAQAFTTGITLIEGIPESSEDFSANPLLTVLSKTIITDASTGEQDLDTFFQVGALIQRSFVCSETAGNVRSDTSLSATSVTSGQIPLMSKINFRANKTKDMENYRIAETVDGAWNVAGYFMVDFANNQQPFIPTASGLKIDGLSTIGYNVGDLVFTANRNAVSQVIRRVQSTIEG